MAKVIHHKISHQMIFGIIIKIVLLIKKIMTKKVRNYFKPFHYYLFLDKAVNIFHLGLIRKNKKKMNE